MQSNQNIRDDDINIIDDAVWDNLYNIIKNDSKELTNEELTIQIRIIDEISCKYNIDKKNIIKDFLNYIIRNYDCTIVSKYLNFVENIVHFEDCKNSYYVNYSLIKLSSLIKEL
jgi:hypothetical protein